MTVCSPARHPAELAKLAKIIRFLGIRRGAIGALFLLALGGDILISGGVLRQSGPAPILLLATPPDSDLDALAHTWPNAIDPQRWLRDAARVRRRAELSRLGEVDAAITRARRAMASLGETEALRELADAERTLSSVLTLPGAAAFYAEVQLQLGVSAAQLGQLGLAQAAFARAARVDPARRLLAGEAAPEIVMLATRAFALVERAPEGEVRIVVNAPDARVFLDDRERGSAPLSLRAGSGTHLLRIEAPGHLPYAGLYEIAEGQRPEQRFSLAEEPRHVALRDAHAVSGSAAAAALRASAARVLANAPELQGLLFVERAGAERAVLVLCERKGCSAPLRHVAGRARVQLRAPGPAIALSAENLADARAWLRTPALAIAVAHAETASVWQRWYVWAGVSAAVIGGVALAVAATQPEPERRLRVSVDPSALH